MHKFRFYQTFPQKSKINIVPGWTKPEVRTKIHLPIHPQLGYTIGFGIRPQIEV